MKALFFLVLLAAAGFVWLTGEGLPPVVASHFGAGGAANGFSSRGSYTALMLAMVIGVPALVASTSLLVRVLPPQLVNLPNKRYWLAPERREATLEALASISLAPAIALALFLCYVHWLVIRANAVRPPRLDEAALFGGLAVAGVAIVAWLVLIYRRFRLP